MKKNLPFIIVLALICNAQISLAQKISKQEANALLEKAVTFLKNNDTAAFVNLWYLDNSVRPYDNTTFTKNDIIAEFNELKLFLDTAIKNNLSFDYIEIRDEKDVSKHKANNVSSNKLLAWYLYDAKHKYYKGFGVRSIYMNNRWLFRFNMQYSISNR